MNFASDPWHLYATGYLEAANELVENIASGNIRKGKVDKLAYPIAFMYRHHIELKIKQLYLKVCYYLKVTPTLKTTHTLLGNWEDFKVKLSQASANFNLTAETIQYLQVIEIKLNQLATLDNTSISFRYPIDKSGSNHHSNRNYLHLGQLGDFVTELAQDLENLHLELTHWIELDTEWKNYYDFSGNLDDLDPF